MARSPLRILFVTSEAHPLTKTGGLADVSAALPAALNRLGIDCRILMPAYPAALAGARSPWVRDRVTVGSHGEVGLIDAYMPGTGVRLILVDHPGYFRREGGPYQMPGGADWPDNALRFALLGEFAALLASDTTPLPWKPDIVHVNDWQGGLTPAYIKTGGNSGVKTVMTIHNLAFQGIFPPQRFVETGLPQTAWGINGVEYYGNVSYLKAGLFFADRITTVSPTYAREIQTEALGFGMQGLLATRKADLTGILNGIDDVAWNPVRDPHIARHYSAAHLGGKAEDKRALQASLGLAVRANAPVLGVVSRLTYQKGLDLLVPLLPGLVEAGAQLVVLGTGDAELEAAFRAAATRFPDTVSVTVGYDEGLAHRIEAGADMFVMPSRFEPCGLNQMYSQRYGTVPVVHATGGLADTVTEADDAALADGTATGFVFHGATVAELSATLDRALAGYSDKRVWRKLQRTGMQRDFSWTASAQRYLELYAELAARSL